MNILILGGTGFLGRHIVREAVTSGFDVTCLARGSSGPEEGSRFICSNRDDEGALQEVRGTYWDAIVDLTSQPHHARKAIAELKTSHAIYISSSSVYEDQSAVKVESDSLVPVLQSEAMNDVTQYPFAKAACESFYKAAFERVTIIRPGLIGGFGDVTGRSGYYPWRFMNPVGNHVVVPDTSFPVAMIDAVDLAQWILKCMRDAITGVFNASGKATSLSEVIETSKKITHGTAQSQVFSDEFLLTQGVQPWMGVDSLPLWVPGESLRKLSLVDSSLARTNGLVTRPLQQTLSAALEFEKQRETPRQAGLSDDKERQILDCL